MIAPAVISARGTVRRASLISSPMNDAASAPLKAYRRVAHTPNTPGLSEGAMLVASKLVAEPNFIQATTATAHNRATGIHVPCEPTLFSHLPMLSPTTFRASASPTPKNENPMKYAGLTCHAFQRFPPT